MDKEIQDKLCTIGYKVIEQEHLPTPQYIKFRSSLSGNRRSSGRCIRKRGSTSFNPLDKSYHIIVNLIQAKFIPDATGRFIDKKTGIKYRRCLIGKENSFERVVYILAHEIAHLKFWYHTPEHVSYTNHILRLIKNELGDTN